MITRRTLIAGATGSLAIAGALSSTAMAQTRTATATATASPAASPETDQPTVVLVHGAFAGGASWSGVIRRLQAAGVRTLATANPLRGIATDAAYTAAIVDAIAGPVLLVGHSYGGAVITNAGAEARNVVGLVFVAAFAPDEGETVFQVLQQFAPTALGPALRPMTASTTDMEFIIDPASYHDVFAADLPAEQTAPLSVSQRPVAASAFTEPSGAPAWKSLPSYFALATQDQALGTEIPRFYAERAGGIIAEVEGSHSVAMSQPDAIANLIISAYDTVR